jgi:hypothetical protein
MISWVPRLLILRLELAVGGKAMSMEALVIIGLCLFVVLGLFGVSIPIGAARLRQNGRTEEAARFRARFRGSRPRRAYRSRQAYAGRQSQPLAHG